MADSADYAENHDLWLAKVEIALVNPEQGEPVRSYLIAAPDKREAEHILRDYHSPGSLKSVLRLDRLAQNIARVYGPDNQPIDLTTAAESDEAD